MLSLVGEVPAVDVRQWSFDGEGDAQAQVRPGRPLVLRATLEAPTLSAADGLTLRGDAPAGPALALDGDVLAWAWPDAAPGRGPGRPDAAPEPAAVTVRRVGSSLDALRHGERVGLLVDPAPAGPGGPGGYLVAGAPGGGVVLAPASGPPPPAPADVSGPARQPWWAQWEITGQVPGAGVAAGRPVGLLNLVEGDHLVRAGDGRSAPALGWWSPTSPDGALPAPPALRPPDASAGEIEVHGSLVPAGPDAGLLLLDAPAAGLVGEHLARRLPARAADLAPGGAAASLAVRWPTPLPAGVAPDAGVRVWLRGVLVASPGLALARVRGAAWPLTTSGDPVLAAPAEPGWPAQAVAWRVVTWGTPVTWALPLPARDGERGSSTTFTRLREPVPVAAGPRRPGAGLGAVPPTFVRDVRTGRRAVRFVGLPGTGPGPSVAGVTVRVHLRDRWST